jgi:type IV secretory pathway VirB3-like protein
MEEEPLGYASEVHTSLLEPILLFKQVPYLPGIGNCLFTMIVMVTFQFWTFLFIGVALHGLMYLATRVDHQLIEIAARLLTYPSYCGTR